MSPADRLGTLLTTPAVFAEDSAWRAKTNKRAAGLVAPGLVVACILLAQAMRVELEPHGPNVGSLFSSPLCVVSPK